MLTRDTVELAFDKIGKAAREAGIVCEIAVFGGTAIMLASDIRKATQDVDAVFDPKHREFLYNIAATVAWELNLPEDWLNEAVRRLAPPPGGSEPNLALQGEYPRDNDGPVGLRVDLPPASYLLAMKLLANRSADDLDKQQTDLIDIQNLMKVTGIETYEGLLALMRECYPNIPNLVEPSVSERLQIKLRTVLDAYNPGELSPTWDAGIGPATR